LPVEPEGPGETTALDRARRGDPRAFEELLEAHSGRLFAHVARVLGAGADAEDVVQEACISAWRSIGSFEGTSFRAWLFRIATNRAIDVIRQRRRRGELPLEVSDEEEVGWAEPAAPGPEVHQLASGRETMAVVEEALARIPPEQRAALLLRDVEGFDYAEIARITAAEPGTVRSRIHRGRLAVRNALIARGWKGSTG
jgi:RNA polymerase sigma factor (sigma-70 family)